MKRAIYPSVITLIKLGYYVWLNPYKTVGYITVKNIHT